jgi:hypothetical protein
MVPHREPQQRGDRAALGGGSVGVAACHLHAPRPVRRRRCAENVPFWYYWQARSRSDVSAALRQGGEDEACPFAADRATDVTFFRRLNAMSTHVMSAYVGRGAANKAKEAIYLCRAARGRHRCLTDARAVSDGGRCEPPAGRLTLDVGPTG